MRMKQVKILIDELMIHEIFPETIYYNRTSSQVTKEIRKIGKIF